MITRRSFLPSLLGVLGLQLIKPKEVTATPGPYTVSKMSYPPALPWFVLQYNHEITHGFVPMRNREHLDDLCAALNHGHQLRTGDR